MTVDSAAIQAAMEAALVAGPTAAGANVFTPRNWPTEPVDLPMILVSRPRETKQGRGRSGHAKFNCVVTIRVVGRVYVKARIAPDKADAASAAALAAAAVLQRQIEVAVVENALLRQAGVQQFSSVDIETDVKTEGEFTFGETVMDFALEFFQGDDDFHPIDADPLDELAIFADLLNIYSVTGDFTGEPDATPWVDDATAEPRKAGPDGRAEVGLVFDFTVPEFALDFSVAENSGYLPLV